MKRRVLIFTGMAGVGKTTLINFLVKRHSLKVVDVYESVLKIIEKTGRTTLKEEELRAAYEIFFEELPRKDFEIVEIASEWPDEILPRLVEIIREKGKKRIVLVFCEADKRVVLKRIKTRGRPIPSYLIKEQSRYNRQFFLKLCGSLGIDFLAINTSQEPQTCYHQLIKKLGSFENDIWR